MWLISLTCVLLIAVNPMLKAVNAQVDDFCFGFPTEDGDESKTIGFDYLLKQKGWRGFGAPDDKNTVRFKVEAFGIEVDGHKLNGWLHLVISSIDKQETKNAYIDRFALVARGFASDAFHSGSGSGSTKYPGFISGIGEFVKDFPKCDGEDKHFYPGEMYMPCGGVSARDPTLSNGFMYLHSKDTKERKEVHLNFRFTQTPCNLYNFMSFRLKGFWSDKPSGSPQSDKYVSAANSSILKLNHLAPNMAPPDPIPRYGTFKKINCKVNPVYNCSTFLWVKDRPIFSKDCINDYACKPAMQKTANPDLFSHRCSNKYSSSDLSFGRTDGKSSNSHICQINREFKVKKCYSRSYADLIKSIREKAEDGKLCEECVDATNLIPPRPLTTAPTQPTTDKSDDGGSDGAIGPYGFHKRGYLIDKDAFMDELWDSRIVHGIAMTILVIFVMPVNHFITRYFKETFMDTRIMFHHVWYFVHHTAVGVSFILYLVGLYRINNRRNIIGVSLSFAATAHRSLGWVTVVICILLTIFGGCRTMARFPRSFSIALHWTFGMLVYFINISCMLSSVSIPGSPSATTDVTVKHKGLSIDLVMVLVILWLVFDISMHVVMTFLGCRVDNTLVLTRPRYYFPTPIPILEENYLVDLPGTRLRKLMLFIYLGVSIFITFVICIMIRFSDWSGRGIGPMSCTHNDVMLVPFKGDDC